MQSLVFIIVVGIIIYIIMNAIGKSSGYSIIPTETQKYNDEVLPNFDTLMGQPVDFIGAGHP